MPEFDLDHLNDLFDGEPSPSELPINPAAVKAPWLVLCVDDEESVLAATAYALDGVTFAGRGLSFLFARNAAEARTVVEEYGEEIAVIFLDVVMETDSAGLDFARWLREEHKVRNTRVVLRTGQPGKAPEREVIIRYEIDDYKTKTELTADKLFITIVAALRMYQTLVEVEYSNQELKLVVDASANLFQTQGLEEFADSVVNQFASILSGRDPRILFVTWDEAGQQVVSSTGGLPGEAFEDLSPEIQTRIRSAFDVGSEGVQEDSVVFTGSAPLLTYAIYVSVANGLTALDHGILTAFNQRVVAGIAAAQSFTDLSNTYEALIRMAARITEYKDDSVGGHTIRVATYAAEIAKKLYRDRVNGASSQLARSIGNASILHDIGKVAIRDDVLLKPGALNAEERAHMETHTEIGRQLLATCAAEMEGSPYLSLAAIIAGSHHERWDGKGYPDRLAGESIPLAGRVVSVAEVYDSLTNDRPFRSAWSHEEAVAYLEEQSGTQFDPKVVSIFISLDLDFLRAQAANAFLGT